MSEQQRVYPGDERLAAGAWVDRDRYETLYRQSVEDPEGFCGNKPRA